MARPGKRSVWLAMQWGQGMQPCRGGACGVTVAAATRVALCRPRARPAAEHRLSPACLGSQRRWGWDACMHPPARLRPLRPLTPHACLPTQLSALQIAWPKGFSVEKVPLDSDGVVQVPYQVGDGCYCEHARGGAQGGRSQAGGSHRVAMQACWHVGVIAAVGWAGCKPENRNGWLSSTASQRRLCKQHAALVHHARAMHAPQPPPPAHPAHPPLPSLALQPSS